jgi:hypothetical protein
MTSTAAATSSLVDLKRVCALLTGIACGVHYPYAHLDGLPPESFDALVRAIRQLELAAQQTRLLPEEPPMDEKGDLPETGLPQKMSCLARPVV